MPSWDLHHREAGEKREQPEPVCSTDTDISGAGLDQARQELLYQETAPDVDQVPVHGGQGPGQVPGQRVGHRQDLLQHRPSQPAGHRPRQKVWPQPASTIHRPVCVCNQL